MAAALAADDVDVVSGQRQAFGDEPEQRFVGRSVDRRRREPHQQRAGAFARNFGSPRPRDDADVDFDAGFGTDFEIDNGFIARAGFRY